MQELSRDQDHSGLTHRPDGQSAGSWPAAESKLAKLFRDRHVVALKKFHEVRDTNAEMAAGQLHGRKHPFPDPAAHSTSAHHTVASNAIHRNRSLPRQFPPLAARLLAYHWFYYPHHDLIVSFARSGVNDHIGSIVPVPFASFASVMTSYLYYHYSAFFIPTIMSTACVVLNSSQEPGHADRVAHCPSANKA